MSEENTPKPSESDTSKMTPDSKATSDAKAKASETTAAADKKPDVKSDDEADKPGAKQKPAAKAADKGDKPAAKKKEKPPAPEDKPFPEFITEHFMPEVKKSLAAQGIDDLELTFKKQPLPVKWVADDADYWQVLGQWQNGHRQFMLAFQKDDISAPKFISLADDGAHFTTIESFMIDERRVNLDLMAFYVVQRLNGQKWLVRN
jgi:hypothetical protein